MIASILTKYLRLVAGWLLWCNLLAPSAHAMAFYSTADITYNTTSPSISGTTPADGGWQWVGYWGSFQGAPIDAHHFISANHVGGTVGDSFTYQGINYTTVSTAGDSASDLRIWEVRETFPTWAPLYRNSTESGTLMVFGRGVTRGAEVRTAVAVTGAQLNSLAGWQWGSYDGKLRWGQNTVAGIGAYGGSGYGNLIAATFDKTGGANECCLGIYDSSAPVFIKDGTIWKLAGVALSVSSGFSTTSGGSTFSAFIFDARGLYVNGALQTGTSAIPSAFFATRISDHTPWIDGVLAQPLTATITLSNLNQSYDGTPHPVTVTTSPSGLSVTVTYDGAANVPINPGSYAISATASGTSNSYAYSGSATGTLTITTNELTENNDVPAMPLWAVILLGGTIFSFGSCILKRHSPSGIK